MIVPSKCFDLSNQLKKAMMKEHTDEHDENRGERDIALKHDEVMKKHQQCPS